MTMLNKLIQWFKSLFKRKEKAQIPSPMMNPSAYVNTKPIVTPKKIFAGPRKYVKPNDPRFRYGSSHLTRLRSKGHATV
jgi:hypothetical protein